MVESFEHKKLVDEVCKVLEKYKWYYEVAAPGESRVDIIATDGIDLYIEIELSGQNIQKDLDNGAEVFITLPDLKSNITELVRKYSNPARVMTVNEFELYMAVVSEI